MATGPLTINNNTTITGDLTVIDSISSRGSITASQSIIPVSVINLSNDRVFTNTDTNKVFHFDTSSTSLTAAFPTELSEGFNVAIMNTGTNSLILSSNGTINSIGSTIATRYGSSYVYTFSGQLFAVGRLI